MAAPVKTKVKDISRKMAKMQSEIKDKVDQVLNHRRNCNNIIDIIKYIETSYDEVVVIESIQALETIFTTLMKRNDMYLNYTVNEIPESGLTAEEEYKVWLKRRYEDCSQRLIEKFQTKNQPDLPRVCLTTLMKFLQVESHHPFHKLASNESTFPVKLFQSVVTAVLSLSSDTSPVTTTFQDYLQYDDCRYYCLKNIWDLLKSTSKNVPEILLNNVFAILSKIAVTKTDDNKLSHFLTKPPDDLTKVFYASLYKQKKMYTNAWVTFLQKTLPTSMYKKVLLILSDQIMPNLTSPLLLADFLTTSYNIGGAISLLALNGLFILVYYHNLDYPDFYTKLYALFTPNVFHVKYKARFLHLADKFLTSSHISAYLVAAFIKKLSRLALTAPCSAQVIIIPLIINLMIRHPNCAVLINRPQASIHEVSDDPYDMTEADPSKCKAMESSLWEIRTLQDHAYHKVSQLATMINHPLPKEEINISSVLETDYDTLFDKERRKKLKTAAVTFTPPTSLMEECQGQLWALD